MNNSIGKKRAIIKHVRPEIDCGLYPVKRSSGEKINVEADIFSDGHDEIKAELLYRKSGTKKWNKISMKFIINDHWFSSFSPEKEGLYEYTIQGWVDVFHTWQRDIKKKFNAGQDIRVELQMGIQMIEEAIQNALKTKENELQHYLKGINNAKGQATALEIAESNQLRELMNDFVKKETISIYPKILTVDVERKKAGFSAWYELFPRSASQTPGKPGTFNDVIKLLPEIATMGFDVLYLPPIHPIGESFRKGKDNAPECKSGDPGSPWAIGSKEGGHKAIHPQLGSLNDFKNLVLQAKSHDIEVAIDIAFQCSPDHPYVKEHPNWFIWRPDGTVQYAENPPKKYQDVLPLNFGTDDWRNLWAELKSIFDYWIDKGVKIFRVDNPHTKPFHFWEWVIKEIRKDHPEVIFLAEAFTRPRIMEHLAKIGFTQSYTYFTWRHTRDEMIQYVNELTKTPVREFYRPNFWPNTPDILPESLQYKEEGAFITRVVMASTLSSNYGIYGPSFEFGLNEPHPDREEYINNEKYEIKQWDWHKQTKIKQIISIINKTRKENPALQTTWNIYIAETENTQLLCYGKTDDAWNNKIIIAVNMDPVYKQGAWVKFPLYQMKIDQDKPFKVNDVLSGKSFEWQGEWNYVELDPKDIPAHIFIVEEL